MVTLSCVVVCGALPHLLGVAEDQDVVLGVFLYLTDPFSDLAAFIQFLYISC